MSEYSDNQQDDERLEEELELTDAEKRALEQLPRDRVPSRALEDRVVRALRDRGLLQPPHARVIEMTARRIVGVAAACIVLLATGFVLGQWVEERQFADSASLEEESLSAAASVQEAGSAYLLALEHLTDLPDSVGAQQAAQGQEVAMATLCTAVDRIARAVPRNIVAGRLLAALDAEPDARALGGRGGVTIESNRVIEF